MPSSQNNDRNFHILAWLGSARAGSRESLGRALDACRQYLLGLADGELDRNLRPKGDAADLVQETFLDAQCHFPNFRGETAEQFLAWLTAILRSHASNFARQYRHTAMRKLSKEVALNDPGRTALHAALPVSDETPSKEVQRREEKETVSKAVSRLPDDYRRVVLLRHFEQRSFGEVATLMGRTEAAARKLWLRALERLEQELDPAS